MNIKVCRDILAIVTRAKCEKPSCGCSPRETMLTNVSIVDGDPINSLIKLLINANICLRSGEISPGSFENGLLVGIAIAAASDNEDLYESIRAAAEINPDIKAMLSEVRPQ